MANSSTRNFYYPARVIEKSEIKELDDGKSLINIVVSRAEEIVKGFTQDIEKRIVMFNRKAQEANAGIEVGDYVIFTQCDRSPRAFTTEKGNYVETVDVLAKGFMVQSKKDFDKINATMMSQNLVPKATDLDFTDADKQAAIGDNGLPTL